MLQQAGLVSTSIGNINVPTILTQQHGKQCTFLCDIIVIIFLMMSVSLKNNNTNIFGFQLDL